MVETLVAGIILAMSAAAMSMTVRQGMQSLQRARDYQIAAELLDTVLTKIDTIGPAKMLEDDVTEGVFEGDRSRFGWTAKIEERGEAHLYEVTATVHWRSPDGARHEAEARTLLNDDRRAAAMTLSWNDL